MKKVDFSQLAENFHQCTTSTQKNFQFLVGFVTQKLTIKPLLPGIERQR